MSDLSAPRMHVRVRRGMSVAANWLQLARFGLVGASGYVVNLAVFWIAAHAADIDHRLAATLAFLVAVTNNFVWNRSWTFAANTERMHRQALRFFAVSVFGFVVALAILEVLIRAGLGELAAQAISVAVAMPVNFLANRLWTFRG